jgi:hypothetical protein
MQRCFFLYVFLFSPVCLSAQDILWKASVHTFFDNNEFAGSSVQNSQTMAGVHLAPEMGMSWEKRHRIFAGADVMHEFGGSKIIDYADPIVYYEFAGKAFRFYVGAVPRRMLLDRYPRMFFSDSIRNYRPTINGVFWEYQSGANYANVWLDWTGRQSPARREAFFIGWSGRYSWKNLYVQHFGYMFHLAKRKNPAANETVHDNGLILTSAGIDLSSKTILNKLEINAGWSVGLDRDRGIGAWNTPQGFLSETKIGYKCVELFNTWYKGGSQQVFYNDFGNELYWGDPIYRSKAYDRLDMKIHFIKTNVVAIQFIYSLHFTERRMYHEQAFYATFDLDNLTSRNHNGKLYLYE